MGMRVIDHTDEWWQRRRDRRRAENGAATYSRDIVTHHVARWAKLAHNGTDLVVSTAPPLVAHPDIRGDMVVQYLHTYDYKAPTLVADRVTAALGGRVGRILFVSAYRPLVNQLTAAGYDAIHIPMRVDADWIRHLAGPAPLDAGVYGSGRAVYFGNITPAKMRHFTPMVRQFEATGWRLDVVSEVGDQRAALRTLRSYSYGIGVGRCALEMMALGMRVMISGAKFGGIVTSVPEWEVQSGVNFNGRVITYDRTIPACVEAWDRVPDWSEAADTYTAVGVLDQHINRLLT